MRSRTILHKNITGSTMTDAREAIHSGSGHGTVCTASSQTMGRGRVAGRRWVDDGNGVLLFTLILHRKHIKVLFPLTQLFALALCRRLENGFGLRPQIKWPNDVMVDRKKIAGIIVETEGDFFLGGMGVNLLQREFPASIRQSAVSLVQALQNNHKSLDEPFLPARELTFLLSEIDSVILECPGIEEIESRLAEREREVTVRPGDPARNDTMRGIIIGLQHDGALLVRSAEGRIRALYSGEIESSLLFPHH